MSALETQLESAESLVERWDERKEKEQRLEELEDELETAREKHEQLQKILNVAESTRKKVAATYERQKRAQVEEHAEPINGLYSRAQVNAVHDKLDFSDWPKIVADAGGELEEPAATFSQGQRQDLALAIFLARARTLGGTFFLDEPLIYLDDLNRVALLDIFRVMALEQGREEVRETNLVVTTASRNLMRHMVEKFARLAGPDGTPLMKLITLGGNCRVGVGIDAKWIGGRQEEPVGR